MGVLNSYLAVSSGVRGSGLENGVTHYEDRAPVTNRRARISNNKQASPGWQARGCCIRSKIKEFWKRRKAVYDVSS